MNKFDDSADALESQDWSSAYVDDRPRTATVVQSVRLPRDLSERLFAAACVFVALRERDRRISENAFCKKIGLSAISLRKGCTLAGLTTARREVVPPIDLSAIA